MRKKYITKKYKYKYGQTFNPETGEKVEVPLTTRISGEGFVFITTYDGKVIRQSFVDENGKQFWW